MKSMHHGIMRDLEAEAKAYAKRTAAIVAASKAQQRSEIERVCARYELEPDEFQTAEQKALSILRARP